MKALALLAALVLASSYGGAAAQPPSESATERKPGAHPAQRSPSGADFPTGPAIGERLPDFRLPNQRGETVDFHADRGGSKAAVMFQRSAVW